MNPRVKAVAPKDDFKLEITFTNGAVGLFDCANLLTFGVFKELADIRYFRQVGVLHGTVVWPSEQDICPDTLYEDSKKEGSKKVAPVSAESEELAIRGGDKESKARSTATTALIPDQAQMDLRCN
jgi:hypothetical protein